MTGAENLMNTLINLLSMIDRGFTVTLTVQPHDWDGDDEDYEEEDDDDEDEPHVSDKVIEEIKEFAHRINDGVPENIRDVYDHILREMGDGIGDMPKPDAVKWPSVGDEVWYKTRHGNYKCGKVKVVCHNTIQLEGNVTLERKYCMKVPFEVGEEVWFDLGLEIRCGYVEKLNDADCLIRTKKGVVQKPYARLFDSVDELLGYLKSTADE